MPEVQTDKVGGAAEAMESGAADNRNQPTSRGSSGERSHDKPTGRRRNSNRRSSANPSQMEPGRIQVSMLRSRAFYVGVARRYFRGYDGNEALTEVTLTALGTAISSAAGVSALLESTNTATIKKVETSYTDTDRQATRAGRNLPRITIVMFKHPDFKDEDPAPKGEAGEGATKDTGKEAGKETPKEAATEGVVASKSPRAGTGSGKSSPRRKSSSGSSRGKSQK